MGGDDLGSDDEYLSGEVVEEDNVFDFGNSNNKKNKSVLEASTVAVIDEEDDNHKRKRNSEDDAISPGNNKKSKTKPSRQKLLLKAGSAIEQESAENQSSFLWTALLHHHELKSGKEGKDEDEPSELQPKLQPFHLITPKSGTDFASRLRECLPSMKQLKTWKHTKSPLAIIVCLSARRAVQVLKDMKPFKTRAAKLFAKHLTVQEQTEWLQQTPFGLAVGTPHRLNVLCQSGALQLSATRLIILDAHQDSKGFTVCTLPDTAPHCMEFLKDRFLPALKERPKQIKLAFC